MLMKIVKTQRATNRWISHVLKNPIKKIWKNTGSLHHGISSEYDQHADYGCTQRDFKQT